MKDKILVTLMVAVSLFVLMFVFAKAASIPDVHVSYSTDECVKVINYVEGENYSCENLPSKFNHVWVQ
jgi:hypothetical protein